MNNFIATEAKKIAECEVRAKQPGISLIMSGLEHQLERSREAAMKAEKLLSAITGESAPGANLKEDREPTSISERINGILDLIAINNEIANSALDRLTEYMSS